MSREGEPGDKAMVSREGEPGDKAMVSREGEPGDKAMSNHVSGKHHTHTFK